MSYVSNFKPLSSKALSIEPSATLKVSAKTKELKSKGLDVINMTAGESDLLPPQWLIENLKLYSSKPGVNLYKPTAGIPELREEIARKYQKYNGINYTKDEVIITIGGKHAIYLALAALCNDGDEVIVISPYWVSYVEQVKIVGAKPVILETDSRNGFIPDINKLRELVNAKTKAIIVNSPNNPTGAVYPAQVLKRIFEIAYTNGFYVISDEIYENFVYEGDFISFASIDEKAKDMTIVINGFSKSHSVTGWRIGYACANKEIINLMDSIQSHISSGTSSLVQYAFLGFLDHYEEDVKSLSVFKERRDYIANELKGICSYIPSGAFYYFIDVSKFYNGDIKNSVDFCEKLLDKKLLSLVPGVAFGDDRYVRLSFACSMETIKEGIKRLKEFFESL